MVQYQCINLKCPHAHFLLKCRMGPCEPCLLLTLRPKPCFSSCSHPPSYWAPSGEMYVPVPCMKPLLQSPSYTPPLRRWHKGIWRVSCCCGSESHQMMEEQQWVTSATCMSPLHASLRCPTSPRSGHRRPMCMFPAHEVGHPASPLGTYPRWGIPATRLLHIFLRRILHMFHPMVAPIAVC